MERSIMTLKNVDIQHLKQVLVAVKTFLTLVACSCALSIVIGGTVLIQQSLPQVSVHTLNGLAASVPVGYFGEIVEQEMPGYKNEWTSEPLAAKHIAQFFIQAFLNVSLYQPGTILNQELSGFDTDQSYLIRKGQATNIEVGPQDHMPYHYNPMEGLDPEEGSPLSSELDPDQSMPVITDDQSEHNIDKVAFIYHTHNRESWIPELENGANDPNSSTKNITLVGKRLAESLEKRGIGALHSNSDYPTEVQDYEWAYSYKYSKKTVKEALASYNSIEMLFDLHRDSQKKEYTTVDIDGTSYAQVYFIIGQKNKNWKENEKFATQIHDKLEELYPGISRGIWGKTAASGNAEYNQSLSTGSVLIEIGGVENTLEESYRTADALAEAIASIYEGNTLKASKEE